MIENKRARYIGGKDYTDLAEKINRAITDRPDLKDVQVIPLPPWPDGTSVNREEFQLSVHVILILTFEKEE